MKLDSKKILTIGAGAVVGYLLFCKFMKSGAEKSLDTGASTDEGGFGGGGGGFGGGAIAPLLPVNQPIVTTPIYTISRDSALISNVQSGNSPIASGDASANYGRATPPPSSSSTPIVVPSSVDISNVSDASANIGRDTSTSAPKTTPIVDSKPNPPSLSRFTDFDGNPNFQDALL